MSRKRENSSMSSFAELANMKNNSDSSTDFEQKLNNDQQKKQKLDVEKCDGDSSVISDDDPFRTDPNENKENNVPDQVPPKLLQKILEKQDAMMHKIEEIGKRMEETKEKIAKQLSEAHQKMVEDRLRNFNMIKNFADTVRPIFEHLLSVIQNDDEDENVKEGNEPRAENETTPINNHVLGSEDAEQELESKDDELNSNNDEDVDSNMTDIIEDDIETQDSILEEIRKNLQKQVVQVDEICKQKNMINEPGTFGIVYNEDVMETLNNISKELHEIRQKIRRFIALDEYDLECLFDDDGEELELSDEED